MSEENTSGGTLVWVRKAVLGGALVGVVVVVPIAIRATVEGSAALDEALGTDDIDLRIERLGHAARWRMPIATHDERALDALVEIGESRNDEASLAAYREARRALLGTRAWGLSDPARFEMLCERIATAMAAREEADASDVGDAMDDCAEDEAIVELDRLDEDDDEALLAAARRLRKARRADIRPALTARASVRSKIGKAVAGSRSASEIR